MKKLALRLLFSTASILSLGTYAQNMPQLDLPRINLAANMHQMNVQIASTPRQREIGLMFRRVMPANEGMLFVFEQPAVQCFWMKNTILPLSAAFVADDGSIVNIVDMQAQTTKPHCSQKAVRYVLELNLGWFTKRGIKAGFRLTGIPFAHNPS